MSLRKTVASEMSKMPKKGIRSIEVSKAANGGFIAEHRHHDYDNPNNGKKHVFKSAKEVGKHIEDCKGDMY